MQPILLVGILVLGSPLQAAEEPGGVIAGTVTNASRAGEPVAQAEVALRLRRGDQWVLLKETSADRQGRFLFKDLPLGPEYEYLPGANLGGVHYPGPRLHLISSRPRATVELSVWNTVSEACPLIIRQQDILIKLSPGALHVTETILIENPSTSSYVGRAPEAGGEPVTLRLAIPANFVRTTFDKEFFGRRFTLADGKLVTGIPWPPGKRELKFTYTLPSPESQCSWQRPLDLPCDRVRVRIETANPDEVSCNLPQQPSEERGQLVFESTAALGGGTLIDVELGRVAAPWMARARWLALALLAVLGAGAGLLVVRRRSRPPTPTSSPSAPSISRSRGTRRRGRPSSLRAHRP